MARKTIPGLPEVEFCTIYCIGRNYSEHAKELNNDVPENPMIFLKPASSIIFDGDSIHLPKQSNNVHHEVELVVALGKEGKNISQTDALEYVAGYGVGIDVTARDLQQQAKEKSYPWAVAKGFDTFAPISNFVPASEISDPQNLEISISVNGSQRQQSNTSMMIFPVMELVSYLSGIFTLHPGDLIFTGTPQGVSPIKKGDQIEATLGESLVKLSVGVQ